MKLLRPTLYAIAIALATTTLCARTAAEYFVDAPNEAMMLFDRTLRMDMLDYHKAGLDRRVSLFNSPDGAVITALSDSSLTISIGSKSTIQFAVLPPRSGANRDTVITIIETTATPTQDSSIFFYTPGKKFDGVHAAKGMPQIGDFLPSGSKGLHLDELPTFLLATAEYIPSENRFIFTNTTGSYYLEDDRPAAVSSMLKTLAYTFDGKSLKPDKKYNKEHIHDKR